MKTNVIVFALLAGALAQDFDILIQISKFVDGTGSPSFHGDFGIKDGRAVALGSCRAGAPPAPSTPRAW